MEFKRLFTILLGSIILFSTADFCFGLDETGCLFCHQYPGMVRLEKTKQLKILHIDEGQFFDSAHGELSCIKCHTTIKSIPHKEDSQVDCTSSCHQDAEEIEMIKDFPLSDFHIEEQSYIVHLDEKSSCAVCHQLYPHSNNEIVRAFLNMHTGFMQCEVCHINKSKFKKTVYEWRETHNAQFSGKSFGTYYNPQTKSTKKNQNDISRITVFSNNNGKKNNLTNIVDIRKAKVFMTKEKNMTKSAADQELLFFHRDIEKKEISVACNECHSNNGILNFSELGFDEKKAKNLKTLNLKGLVTKYKTFYLPNLFEF